MIPLKTRGKAVNIDKDIVIKVTRDIHKISKDTFYLHEDYIQLPEFEINSGIISLSRKENGFIDNIPGVYNVLNLTHLEDGDIISISPNGLIMTIFRINSYHNSLFVTDRCNSNCLMCSQPPKNKDDIEEFFYINSELIKLIPKETTELGITGGEPTLMGDRFPQMIEQLKYELPETNIHVLTNGRSFSRKEVVKQIAVIGHNKLVFGIPLYSDNYQQHDYIVQAKDAFNQTVIGLYNAARYNLRIEIRIVLHKLSIPSLLKLSKYIYKNLPFVEHIALMGLEFTGYTPFNIDKLWIDPIDYQKELYDSVNFLHSNNMNVSIYNHQLCTIPKELWSFSTKSISTWKNDYIDECNNCTAKNECGGFFTSSLKKHSDYITAIT